jgi:hypothetical protein
VADGKVGLVERAVRTLLELTLEVALLHLVNQIVRARAELHARGPTLAAVLRAVLLDLRPLGDGLPNDGRGYGEYGSDDDRDVSWTHACFSCWFERPQ